MIAIGNRKSEIKYRKDARCENDSTEVQQVKQLDYLEHQREFLLNIVHKNETMISC